MISCTVKDKKWTEVDISEHQAHAMRLLDGLEVTAREKRLKVARAILYMAQGNIFHWSGSKPEWLRCMDDYFAAKPADDTMVRWKYEDGEYIG